MRFLRLSLPTRHRVRNEKRANATRPDPVLPIGAGRRNLDESLFSFRNGSGAGAGRGCGHRRGFSGNGGMRGGAFPGEHGGSRSWSSSGFPDHRCCKSEQDFGTRRKRRTERSRAESLPFSRKPDVDKGHDSGENLFASLKWTAVEPSVCGKLLGLHFLFYFPPNRLSNSAFSGMRVQADRPGGGVGGVRIILHSGGVSRKEAGGVSALNQRLSAPFHPRRHFLSPEQGLGIKRPP